MRGGRRLPCERESCPEINPSEGMVVVLDAEDSVRGIDVKVIGYPDEVGIEEIKELLRDTIKQLE